MRVAAVVVLAACGRLGFEGSTSTSARVDVTGPIAVARMHAQLAFSTLDPDELHALPPALPATQTFDLPDAGGPITVTVTATDALDHTIVGIGHGTVAVGQEADITVALDGAYPATCFDGAHDGDETDSDCGGSCPACLAGGRCNTAADCATARCVALTCELAAGPPSWVPIAPLPMALLGIGVVRDGDHLRAIGGGAVDGAGVTATYAYDPTIDAWSLGPSLATPRGRTFAAVDSAGTVYVIGGENAQSGVIGTAEQLAAGATQWTAAPTLVVKRDSAAAVQAADGSIYVIGGGDSVGTALAEVEQLATNAWVARTPMPSARGNTAATRMADGRIVVVGGHDTGSTMWFKTAVALELDNTTWTALPSFNHGRSDLSAVTAPDGRVYVIGGFDGSTGVRFTEAYRPGALGWLDLPTTTDARDGCASAVGPDGRIYVVGGRETTTATASVEAYGPRIVLDRASGVAGDAVTTSGTNFASTASVIIAIDDVPVEAAHTDVGGTFTATFHIPALASGVHVLTAVDASSRYPVHAKLTVQ
jgi:hypothetical protein